MHPEAINEPTRRVLESLAKQLSATWYLAGGTALRGWRDGLVQAFDGLGDRYPGYPAAV